MISNTSRILQILVISLLIAIMAIPTRDTSAEISTDNDVSMITDVNTQVKKVEDSKVEQKTQARESDLAEMNKGVWVAEIQGWNVIPGTIRRLGPRGTFYQPMINRAGTWVTFWGKEAGNQGSDIWIAKTDGTHWQQLTFDGSGNEGPQWSPDGRLIVYSSTRGSSRSHVWVMDMDGSNNRQLTFDPFGGARPAFHPDGNTIVFTSNPPGAAIHWRTEANLWKTDLGGKTPERVTKHDGLDFKANFSPDGQYLAYHTDQTETGKHNLAVIEWSGGANSRQPVSISGDEWLHGPFWSFDNTHILVHGYLRDMTVARLYLVNAFSGHTRAVVVPGFIAWGHGSVDEAETLMSFDGRREIIAPTAIVSAKPLSGAIPLHIDFDGSGSTDTNGHLVSYSWDFGDGVKAIGITHEHIYTEVGVYKATLTVTDDQGLEHSDSVTIDAIAVPR